MNLNSASVSGSAAKKRNAPNAPAGSMAQPQQPIYGTLPHSVGRYQQSYDLSDIYNSNNTSTLPHPPRNSLIQNSSNTSINQPQQFDNKVYERFEPYMMQQANKTSHKRSPSSDSITRSITLGEFLVLTGILNIGSLTELVWDFWDS